MTLRPAPTLADRTALRNGSSDTNPFAAEGFPGDNFDIAAFLRADGLAIVADERRDTSAILTDASQTARAELRDIADAAPIASTSLSALGVLREPNVELDRVLGIDGLPLPNSPNRPGTDVERVGMAPDDPSKGLDIIIAAAGESAKSATIGHATMFDTNGNFNDALLAALLDLPILSPIAMPGGDGFGG